MRKILISPNTLPPNSNDLNLICIGHVWEGVCMYLHIYHAYKLVGWYGIIYVYKFHISFHPSSNLYRRLDKYKQNSSSILLIF